jgi:hypothetical protein
VAPATNERQYDTQFALEVKKRRREIEERLRVEREGE